MSLYSNKFLVAAILFNSLNFVSCKKNNGPAPLKAGTYTSYKSTDFGPVRLFAKSGEIKDQNLIDAYKARFSRELTYGTVSPEDIIVTDENFVRFYSKNYTISQVDNYYQFKSIDSVSYNGSLDQIGYGIVKYKPFYIAKPAPPPATYDVITTFEYIYAAPSANDLVTPMMRVIRFPTPFYPAGPYVNAVNAIWLNNVLNDKLVSASLNSDSLLVQTLNYYYKQ